MMDRGEREVSLKIQALGNKPDLEYYKSTFGFDPLQDLKQINPMWMITGSVEITFRYEKGFPLDADPELDNAGITIWARVDFQHKKIQNFIVFKRGDLEASVYCTHTVVFSDSAEQILTFAEDLILETYRSKHEEEFLRKTRGPVTLPPQEHFAALLTVVGAVAEVGLSNLILATYQSENFNPENIPFGFNAAMQSQVLRALRVVAPAETERILRKLLVQLAHNVPVEWIESRLGLLDDMYFQPPRGILEAFPNPESFIKSDISTEMKSFFLTDPNFFKIFFTEARVLSLVVWAFSWSKTHPLILDYLEGIIRSEKIDVPIPWLKNPPRSLFQSIQKFHRFDRIFKSDLFRVIGIFYPQASPALRQHLIKSLPAREIKLGENLTTLEVLEWMLKYRLKGDTVKIVSVNNPQFELTLFLRTCCEIRGNIFDVQSYLSWAKLPLLIGDLIKNPSYFWEEETYCWGKKLDITEEFLNSRKSEPWWVYLIAQDRNNEKFHGRVIPNIWSIIGEFQTDRWRVFDPILREKSERESSPTGGISSEIHLHYPELNNLDLPVAEKQLLALLISLYEKSAKSLPFYEISRGHLTQIHCENIKLQELPQNLFQLPMLENLTLRFVDLCELPSSIENLHALKTLDLIGNPISQLPDSVGNLSNLQLLNLDQTSLERLPPTLSKIPALQVLSLNGAALQSLPDFNTLPKSLQELNLGELKVPPDQWKFSTPPPRSLRFFDLHGNGLEELPDIINSLHRLRAIRLENNELATFPESLKEVTTLEYLFLDHNHLASLPAWISRLLRLRVLRLSFNRFTGLPPQLAEISSLKTLNLAHNEISSIPNTLLDLPALKTLNIKQIALEDTNAEVYAGIIKGLYLDLSNNEIASVPGWFSRLKRLETLYMGSQKGLHPQNWAEIEFEMHRKGVIVEKSYF